MVSRALEIHMSKIYRVNFVYELVTGGNSKMWRFWYPGRIPLWFMLTIEFGALVFKGVKFRPVLGSMPII